MLIPPYYLACFRDPDSQKIVDVRIESGEIVLEDEAVRDAMLMTNSQVRTAAYISAVTNADQEIAFSLEGLEISLDELERYVNDGGTITLIEHCADGTIRTHAVQVSEVFDSELDMLQQKASA